MVTIGSSVFAQANRAAYLEQEPLAKVSVQSLGVNQVSSYALQNSVLLNQPEQEDALSFYARTLDGEWLIPTQVDRNEPWVRLLVLSSPRPTLVDIAIELDEMPFRLAREEWIDQLQTKAKAVSFVRSGSAIVEAVVTTIDEEKAAVSTKLNTETTTADSAAEENEADEEVPMTAAQRRMAQTASRQLINYLAANPDTVDREEIRWLLAERTGGPTLLTLGSATAWKRINDAPLLQALDQDANQILSREEIEQVADRFKQADINQDEIVDLSELQRLGEQHTTKQKRISYPLVIVIDENTDWNALKKHLQKAYPATNESGEDLPLLERIGLGEQSLHAADLKKLCVIASELVCRVTFGNSSASMALISTGESTNDSWQFISATNEVITLEQESTYVELTAAQAKDSTKGIQQTQVAIGAVVDGYPLFRLLDSDNNHRLTLREQHDAGKLLARLDRDKDGKVDTQEIPTAIRLAVTRGPQVHQHLSQATAAQRKVTGKDSSTAPAWFTGMDTNHDGDISRREFQGSSTQFAKFDRDRDGLISEKEVQ